MVWGCMTASGVGELKVCEGRMNTARYIETLEEVLEPSIVKLFPDNTPEYYFQQDNAPCHKSKKSMRWLAENQIRVLDWPPQSPDLSPIEHLWGILKKKVAKHNTTSKALLKSKIFEEWEEISREVCFNLVKSMPNRVKAVLKAKGGVTKY